ncbi:MAG: hypothetical protein A4E61_00083 [Syntrophorhabdus sp. PtaB.Bin184]|nr:MAG: hypothetical protein A4E61_00083 [Syntrophorhabdus sp. PtaB.Bin184]
MKRFIKAYGNTAVWIGLFVLLVAMCAWSGTVTTSTNIYPFVPAKGYVIYATSFTTAASAEIVPYSTGKRIKVIAYELVANGDTNVKFTSGGADDIMGSTLWYLTQNSGVTKPVTLINQQPLVYMQTAPGASLSINLSAAQSVSGTLLYYVE